MSTKVIKEGNVTTTIMDLTNGVGDKSAEVKKNHPIFYKRVIVINVTTRSKYF